MGGREDEERSSEIQTARCDEADRDRFGYAWRLACDQKPTSGPEALGTHLALAASEREAEGRGEKMMREWSVRFEINKPNVVFTEDHADQVMDALSSHSPSVSYGPHAMSARLCVEADSPKRALDSGLSLLRSALKARDLLSGIVGAEVQALDDLDKSLQDPSMPDLVGVDEVAKMLEVSKQRASELAKRQDFPKPIARLAAGPVWKKAAIARHVSIWDRRPGRKKALVGS